MALSKSSVFFWHTNYTLVNPDPLKIGNGDLQKAFYIHKDDLELVEKFESVGNWTFAPAVLPIKYRIGTKEIASQLSIDFNLGSLIGYRIANRTHMDRSGLYVLGALGAAKISTYGVNTENTKDEFALSIGGGLGYFLKDRIGFMVIYGYDQASTNLDWQYNGRTWIGLGVNVPFNSNDGGGKSK